MSINQCRPITSQGEAPSSYLDDLPSCHEFALDLVFGPGDHSTVATPLDPVSCTNDDLARIDIHETESLCRKHHSIHSQACSQQ